jgi:catechol 2,3-dioxygenase-like lactoylglutathione lyase family enzyme
MKPQPMLAVSDVAASSQWYQRALGLRSGHGGHEYEQLMAGSEMVLQLHHWDVDEHPLLGDPARKPYGNGVLVWFQSSDIEDSYRRAKAAGAAIVDEIRVNPRAQHREFWLRDPDGYVVVVAGAYGDLGA